MTNSPLDHRLTGNDLKVYIAIVSATIMCAIAVFAYTGSISSRVYAQEKEVADIKAMLTTVADMNQAINSIKVDVQDIKTNVEWLKKAVVVDQ